MISRKDSCRQEIVKEMKGGIGEFQITHLVDGKLLGNAGRLFARGMLEPGCSVGWHVHEEDMEICYFLSGSGTVMEHDRREIDVEAGDVQICLPGEGHGIRNRGTTPLVYLAVVLNPGRWEFSYCCNRFF